MRTTEVTLSKTQTGLHSIGMPACIRALGLFLACMVASACNPSTPEDKSARNDSSSSSTQANAAGNGASNETWVNQELLLQLKEVRGELAAVKESLAKLNDQVSKRSGGEGPPAARAPINLELAGLPVTGKRSASVGIVEFSDFGCPYCARHHDQVFSEIKKNFIDTGKVKYFSRQYPLPFHTNAHSAAVAALCASEQASTGPCAMRCLPARNRWALAFTNPRPKPLA